MIVQNYAPSTVRVGDAGLGNRRPNPMGKLYSHCPVCLDRGVVAKLTEHHVIIECLGVRFDRTQFNMPEFPVNLVCSRNALRKYLGGDNAGVSDMLIRAKHIHNILQRWQFITTSLKNPGSCCFSPHF